MHKTIQLLADISIVLATASLLLLSPPLRAHGQCNQCHLEDVPTAQQATLALPLPMLCIDCHMDRTGETEHSINIIPAGPTGALPLVEGKLGCTTCHDPHSTQPMQLRVSINTLCVTCHQY